MTRDTRKPVRQGDVMFRPVADVPATAKARTPDRGRHVIALGEVTGHAHVLDAQHADVYDNAATVYARIMEATPLTHEEHAAVVLDPGVWRYVPQREYSPEAIRNVSD